MKVNKYRFIHKIPTHNPYSSKHIILNFNCMDGYKTSNNCKLISNSQIFSAIVPPHTARIRVQFQSRMLTVMGRVPVHRPVTADTYQVRSKKDESPANVTSGGLPRAV